MRRNQNRSRPFSDVVFNFKDFFSAGFDDGFNLFLLRTIPVKFARFLASRILKTNKINYKLVEWLLIKKWGWEKCGGGGGRERKDRKLSDANSPRGRKVKKG